MANEAACLPGKEQPRLESEEALDSSLISSLMQNWTSGSL